jgi:DNA-binding beta-propeller fold protein YncE/mono/diheme cytochrome c family protein
MRSLSRDLARWHSRAVVVALGLALGASATWAQTTTTLLQQSFTSGLGTFSSAGNVSTGSTGAVMRGSLFSTDGAVTSPSFSTVGYSALTLSFTRVTAGGLTSTEAGIAEVSTNGGASYTAVDSTRVTAASQALVTLPASVAGQANVRLRFRINANGTGDTYTVRNVTLTGTTGGGGGGGDASLPARGEYAAFESGQVRPMALSADGNRLYVTNTPDHRVEIYNVSGSTPTLIESVAVGLEPVALALAPNGNLWVVNHLSDSISVVDVSRTPARVTNTLLVGDEPRDIVFAGAGNKWAFITAAHRGQNAGFDPQLHTPSIGRADVWVFDAANPGSNFGGTPVTRLNMFGDTTRALGRNADGSRVYAAVFNSGNKTTVLKADIPQGGIPNKPPPNVSITGVTAPMTPLIVQKNAAGNWVDSGDPITGTPPRTWNSRVKLDLPDLDVFTIDTTGTTPRVIAQVAGVGTTLFNIAVNPTNGRVYVSNQEARNLVRFEGSGTRGSTVRGHFVESRITVINGTTATPRHLNKHITSYNQNLGTEAERALALATPLEMAVSPDGANLFVTAMGSNRLARISTTQLEANTFTLSSGGQVNLTGGGPTGVVLNPARNLAYVLTRFDNGISVVNTSGNLSEVAHVRMFNPEPGEVVTGRPFLYDATLTSSRGDSSCAGCHIFGDMDHLAWDLGNPDEEGVANTNPYSPEAPNFGRTQTFHPLKGPMTTQTLRGMRGQGPLHWRGDRRGNNRVAGQSLEDAAFKEFNGAFVGLLGRGSQLTAAQMDQFTKFALRLVYPPNPIGNLDGSLTADQAAGMNLYNTGRTDGLSSCNDCHTLNPAAGRFGTDGTMAVEGNNVAENFKIAGLRNMYQKVGMFATNSSATGTPSFGNQIRGFGFENSGQFGNLDTFFASPAFQLSDAQQQQIDRLMMIIQTEHANIVGQQVTISPSSASAARTRLDMLVARALVTSPRRECELVAKGVIGNVSRGWVMNAARNFVPNSSAEQPVTLQGLLDQAAADGGAPITFTCAPVGNGTRMGVDRDGNGTRDRG